MLLSDIHWNHHPGACEKANVQGPVQESGDYLDFVPLGPSIKTG